MNKSIGIIISVLFLFSSLSYADIKRASVSSADVQGNGESAFPAFSADGRFVVFVSSASNLISNDSNAKDDVFVHDNETRTTERVSVSSAGIQGNGASSFNEAPSLSADGRFVVFKSSATNLVDGDTNSSTDIFVHDRLTQVTERVSKSTTGVQGNKSSDNPSISADGRYVSFWSRATNLVDDDSNERTDIFVHDRSTQITERVSLSSTGMQASNFSRPSTISADGRIVAFVSAASNLVAVDSNGFRDVFVHDRMLGKTEIISVSSSGIQGNDHVLVSQPGLSSDGRFVVFGTSATNMLDGNTTTGSEIFVHDRSNGVTELVHVSPAGARANGNIAAKVSISADGRYVSFASTSTNLVDDDNNGLIDIFVYDRSTGLTHRANLSSQGDEAIDGVAFSSTLSADGRFVAFHSNTSNLVNSDTNNVTDVFVADNPFLNMDNDSLSLEKHINNAVRDTQSSAAQLAAGTQYRQSYRVTNNTQDRVYAVRVFENGNLVCNFFSLNPGQTRERCVSFQTVLEGNQQTQVKVTAKVSGSGEVITGDTDSFYTGLIDSGELRVTHYINNINADQLDQAPTLSSLQAEILFKVENTGKIELYQTRTYHQPISPVNSSWVEQCVIGPLLPGQIKYCKRNITLSETGISQAMGRVQARNAIIGATDIVNASNPTYFIAP